jgi:glycosyltransferase involved in cell wall biosynthesis
MNFFRSMREDCQIAYNTRHSDYYDRFSPDRIRSRNTLTNMDISVVLATYNRAGSLRVTLESFLSQVSPADLSWELLVVDNNSTDATRDVVESFARTAGFPTRYILERLQGKSIALNAGVAQARSEIIAFTDDDVLVHPDWLANLKRTFDEVDCSAVAGKVVPTWNHPKPGWLKMEGQFAVTNFDQGDEPKEIRVPPIGANSAFRKDVFRKHGLFRLDLGPNGSRHTITCEDWEFGERLIRAGEKIAYCPTAIVHHPVDPDRTTKKYFLSWYYYNGISLTRTAGLPKDGIFWFGVPRWLYRELLTNFAKWMLTWRGNDRFSRKLSTYRSLGNIVESYRLSHREGGAHVLNGPLQS